MAESHKHLLLKQVAMRWLQSTGCVAWVFEVSFYDIGIVDVCGLKKGGDVYVVEAKISNSDLKNDFKGTGRRHGFKYSKLSKIYKYEVSKQVDFIYYITADGVDTSDLPTFIGLLDESGRIKRRAGRRRPKEKSDKEVMQSFRRVAKALSWRKYKHVINHEQEQIEFSLI